MNYDATQVMLIRWGDNDFNMEVQSAMKIMADHEVPQDKESIAEAFPLIVDALCILRYGKEKTVKSTYFEIDATDIAIGTKEAGQAIKDWGVFVMYDARYGEATWAIDN